MLSLGLFARFWLDLHSRRRQEVRPTDLTTESDMESDPGRQSLPNDKVLEGLPSK